MTRRSQRWIDEVIAENPAEAERFAAGEKKLQGVLDRRRR